jgi:polar amino acid transport system substrate-binding protein
LWFGDREITADEFHILKAFDGDGEMARNLVKAANGKFYEVWTYPVRDRRGKITLVVEAALDVTEKLKAESRAKNHQQQLIQVDKMKSLGILVAGVAHEISNPNNFIGINVSILGKIWKDFLPVIKQQMATNQKQTFGGIPAAKLEHSVKTLLNGINDGSERIKTIVDNLKGYVRETPPDRVELFSVNEALADSTLLMNNLLKKSTRKFTVSAGKNIPPVSGVQQRIEQVIINILQNACHALSTPEQGIKVSTYCNPGSEVVIEVKDEGCGIDEKNLKHITDPFFTTKRDSGGTGLGLSISYSIMEEHKGRLEFESRKGAGTTARIILPAATL